MKQRILILLLFLPQLIFAEGSNEVWVDQPNHRTWLMICPDVVNQCAGFGGGIRSNFAAYDCVPEERLFFETSDPNEVVYMGFAGNNGDLPNNCKYVYRIRDEFGGIAQPEADLPTGGFGFINGIGEARVGPNQVAGAGGYDAHLFTPAIPGVFYIEFAIFNDGTGGYYTGDWFRINLFDVTVYDTLATEVKTGRLYSQSWQFYDGPGGFNWDVNSSTFYIYSTDSIITTVTYDEMEGRAWLMFCNNYGCQNTGNFVVDRMSVQGSIAFVPEYRIFLNEPDTLLYPPASTLGQIIPPVWAEAFCDGTKIFHVTVDKAGNLQITLDIDPPYLDVTIPTTVSVGENLIFWNGQDGNGTQVPNNTNIDFTITYINGLTNLPLYDIEANVNGFAIELVSPAGATPLVYWDDSNIPGGGTNFAGCDATPPNPGCHTFNYGDNNTINTWWYSSATTTAPVTIVEERGPDSLIFGQPPQAYCAGEEGVFISVTVDPNTEVYNWSYTGTGATITHTNPGDNFIWIDFALSATPGDIEVYGTNTNCGDGPTSILPAAISPVPGAQIGISPNDTVCLNELITFTGTDTNSLSILSWLWDFGDGNTATVQNPTHSYTTTQTASVSLIITTNDGCKDTAYFTVWVVDPTIDFTYNPNPSCLGDTVFFNGTGDATFTDWIWDFGDGNTGMGKNTWHIYNTTGLHTVTLNVCTKTANHDQNVLPPPLAEAGSDEWICETRPFEFALAGTPATAFDYSNLQWSTTGTGTFDNPNQIHPIYTPPPGEFGTFTFMLVAYGNSPCGNDTSYMNLSIFDGPEADYTITPGDSICVNETVAFDASSTTNVVNWQWNYGDGNFGAGQNTTHSYNADGIYNIRLVATNDDGCTDTVNYNIEVFELPLVDFVVAPGNSICRFEELTFFGSSTTNILDWYWDFGDGNTALGQNAAHTYTAAGTYNVSLHVYNENSCRDTMMQQVTIFELPTCDFSISPNDTSCINELITFNGTGTADIINWDWDFGDGNISAGQVTTHTYTNPGTYNVRLIATNNNGCLDTMYHQRVVVDPSLSLDFTIGQDPTCETYLVNFTGIGDYYFTDYVWDFGDGNTAIGKNASHAFTTAGTYTVTLTFCTGQVQYDILVNPLPFAFAGQDTASCEDVPFDLSTLPVPPMATDYSSVMWFGGLGTFNDPTLIAPIYTPEDNEFNVNVVLYMVAYGISPCYNDTSWMTIYVTQGAYAFAGSDEDHCQDEPYNFANSTQVPAAYNELQRMWSGGAGTFVDPTAEVPVYIPAPGEVGPITLTFVASNILNCDSLDQMVLTIHPTYFQSVQDTLCYGDSLQLPGGSWQSTTGIYTDTLMSSWNCDSIIETDLYVYPMIDADFTISPSDTACIDDDIVFTQIGTSNLVTWIWDFGDGNTTSAADPTHSYSAAGTYTITYSYTDIYGCSDEVSHDVFVFDHPDVDFLSSSLSACINAEFIFYGISSDDIMSWEWDFGDGGTGSGQNVSHVYTTYGLIPVTLTVTATNGCISTITKSIFVAEPPTADFTYNILSCDTIQFTDLSTAPQGFFLVEWMWYFDDGNTSNVQHPAHAYASGGIYNVSLVVTADSAGMLCSDSVSIPIVVPDQPTVYFTWTPEPTCLGDPTQFFGTSGNPVAEWYWDFGDGNFSYIQNPAHTFLDTGTYRVLLLAKDVNGCGDTVTHDITVVGVPDVSFSINPNPGCAGEQISFNGSSTNNISTWLWDFGDGGQSIDQNPQHVYATAGTYTVTLWVADSNNCFNSSHQSVVINPMPLPDFTHSGVTCSSDTIFFYNQSVSPNGTIIEWVWDFGDGNSVTIAAPDDPDVFHIYAGGGNFNVTLTVLDIDSCSNSVTKPVSITAAPIADFNYEPNCDGQPVVFTDISSPNSGSVIVSWYWEFDDPASGTLNTSTLQNPTHLFTSPGTFDVLLLVENVEGCTDTIVSPVNVNEAPSVSFTTDSDSACVDTDMNFYGNANTGVSWTWDFGDGGTSVLQDPVHVYAAPGTYLVTVTVEDGNACTATYSSNVYVNPLPIADFAFSALPCSTTPVDFSDLSSPMNAYMLSWHWYFGDGNDTILFAPGPGDISHIYDSPGAYTVSLAIENSNGCKDSITYDVSVTQGPLADFEHSGDVCQGGNVEFTDLSQGLGGVVQTWFWQFGDPNSGSNNTSALQNPTHVYSQNGTYVVSLTVTTNNGCQNTAVDTLEIAPPPALDWFNSPDTICHGSLAYFFTDPDTTHIAEVVSFAWNFGDPASGTNDTSNLQNPVHMFTAPGVYTVTMSITNIDGCTNTRIYNVEVNRPPVADFDYEQACLNDSTLFTDMSISQTATITSWLWDFGDPGSGALNSSTLQNTGHVFSALGTYNVQLITTDIMGCADTIVKTLVVDLAPTAYFDYVQPCDPPGFVFFNDSSWWQPGAAPIVEWLWEIEPGYFSSEINPTYTFNEYDSCYVVHLTVTDANGCENHYTDSVCIVPPLEGEFAGTRVCNGDSTFFTSSYAPIEDSILSYKWEMGDGNIILGTADSLYYTYTDPGTYYVTLTMLNQNGCEKSFLQEIIVDALPEVDFSFTPALCNDITSFTDLTEPGAGATISSWLWNFGDTASDDNTSELPNPQHQYPAIDSSYIVSLIITNSHGCLDSTEYILEKGLCMQAVFEVSTTSVCRNTEVCFTDSSYVVGDSYDIHTWQWDMGDGQVYEYNLQQDSICHSYEQWGSYQVMLVVSTTIGADQYSDTTYRMVEVSAEPAAEMIVQAPCAENLTSFFDISDDNGVEITTWQWSFGDPNNANDTSSLQNPTWIYNQTGDYTVELIVENENGCTDTITDEIQVFDNPEAAFSSSLACVGGMTQFTDESAPTDADLSQWLWSFGTGESSGVQNARYVYADTGSYLVEMVVTDENLCRDTTRQMVSVYTVPLSEFEIVDNYESIQGQILLDNFTEGAVRYVWEFGNGDTSQMFSPVVRYEENGTYTIQLISWNENNCPDTALMEYTIEFQGLYVPTGFTPGSSDPVMKEFKPVGLNLESYELVIINQRGNVVFRSNKLDENGSPLEGWDGTTNGEQMPTGNYMWSISAKFQDGSIWLGNDVGDGKQVKTFGMVVLIR